MRTAFSNKVGFCFLDIGRGDPTYNPLPTPTHPADSPNNFKYTGLVAPRTFYHDATLHPAQPCLNQLDGTPAHPWGVTDKVDMGISAGWRDVYEFTLPFQWVDVSDATPGYYWIKSEVDPDNLLREAAGNETNAAAFSTKASVVPGYIGQAGERRPDQRREGVDVQDHAVLDEVLEPRPAHRSGCSTGSPSSPSTEP